MQRLRVRTIRRGWPLLLAMALVLMPTRDARAQLGYGWGYPGWGYGGWGGWRGWGWGGWGYGYPSIAYSYGYPFYGLGNIPITGNFVMGGPGFGYGGLGYGALGLGGFGYAPGGIGLTGVGYVNPMFGAGLTPLGNYSFMMETRLLGRVPRAYPYYPYNTAYRGW